MEMEPTAICRFCLMERRDFKKIEKTDYEILNTLLPTLDLTLTKDPVVCKTCSEVMQKYLAFKTVSLDVRKLLGVRDMCLFCMKSTTLDTFVCLNSQDMNILLLRTTMEQYFPELELQINADLFIICSTCHKDVHKIFYFLINLQSVEQRLGQMCQSADNFRIHYTNAINGVPVEQTEVNSISSIVKLKADQYVKQEPGEDTEDCHIKEERENTITAIEYKSTEISNEGDRIVDQKVKLEYEASESAETDINVNGGNLKIEQVWVEDENFDIKSMNYNDIDPIHGNIENVVEGWINHDRPVESDDPTMYPSTGDNVQDSIERVVRRWAKYKCTRDEMESTKDQSKKEKPPEENKKKLARFVKAKRSRQIERRIESLQMNRKHKNMWWTNTAVISNDSPTLQYFSKTELRAMISRIYVSGEKKYQCQVCQFITTAKCSMNRHMTLHQHPSELETLECCKCDFTTKRRREMSGHIATHHNRSQKPLHRCQYCPFSTKVRNSLRLHLVKHDAATDVIMYECYMCGYKTCHKSTLKTHIISHEPSPDPTRKFKCDKCPYEAKLKANLECHIPVHMLLTGTEMYRCECCGYETKCKVTLSKHLRCHREPLRCIHCGFKTKYNGSMRRHLLGVHSVQVGSRKIDLINALTETVAVERKKI